MNYSVICVIQHKNSPFEGAPVSYTHLLDGKGFLLLRFGVHHAYFLFSAVERLIERNRERDLLVRSLFRLRLTSATPEIPIRSEGSFTMAQAFQDVGPVDATTTATAEGIASTAGGVGCLLYTSTVDPSEDESDFTTSDATEGGEALSLKKLEKAVSKAAKDIASIEKVWLYGSAADAKEVEDSSIDLCVKTEDDDKLKSKHLDAFVAIIEEKTGKQVNVVLKHEAGKDLKQEMKNRVELYKK